MSGRSAPCLSRPCIEGPRGALEWAPFGYKMRKLQSYNRSASVSARCPLCIILFKIGNPWLVSSTSSHPALSKTATNKERFGPLELLRVQEFKNGGSPRCCPVLCGVRDRCIAAMLATPSRREGGVESRFGIGTPVFASRKMVRARGIAPLWSCSQSRRLHRARCCCYIMITIKMALPRGLAPRTSAFAERRAELITP